VQLILDASTVLADGGEQLPIETADDRFPAYHTVLAALPHRVGRVTVGRDALRALLDRAAAQTVRLSTGHELAALPAVVVGATVTLGFAASLLATCCSA
jgi:hypothetical protein